MFVHNNAKMLVVTVIAALVLVGCNSGGAAQPTSSASPTIQTIKDSMGMCEMTVPDGWQPGKTSVIWAYGPEGSKATVLVGAGTGTWEQEKKMVKALYFGQKLTVFEDDSSALTFEGTPPSGQGFSMVGARPAKDHYCWVEITSPAPDAREKLAGDFRKIANSVKGLP